MAGPPARARRRADADRRRPRRTAGRRRQERRYGGRARAARRKDRRERGGRRRHGSAAMIEQLLAAGADPNAALPEGETALMTAARAGNPDAVRALVAHGADV